MNRVTSLPQTGISELSPAVTAHLEGALPGDLQGPGPTAASVERRGIEPAFLADLRRSHPQDDAQWRVLEDPRARVVATGQQPGLLGGPLLVLYKAATAVALAHRTAKRTGAPVLPVFWNATDDVDYDEISTVGWHDDERGLFHLQMPGGARRAEGFVGHLPATGDVEALQALLQRVPSAWSERLEVVAPETARDHGDWVGRWLRRLFPELLVLDARSDALRRHAAPLFERYLQDLDAASDALRDRVRRLETIGHRRVLSPVSMRLGLFLTENAARQKTDDVGLLLQTVRKRPESVSPNVILRPLVQDLLLPTVGFVAGPSEIGYLLELRGLRALLGVPEPALWSRMGGTLLTGGVWADLQHQDDWATWLRAPETAIRQRGEKRAHRTVQAAEDLWHGFAAQLQQFDAEGVAPESRQRALKSLAAAQERMSRDIQDAATRELLRDSPGLRHVSTLVRPHRRPQERVLAGAWLVAQCGTESGPTLVNEASRHLDTLEEGRVDHAVWALEETPSDSRLARQEEG